MPLYDANDASDPFNSKEDWNRIDYKFNGNELYNYFMKISFKVTTVPVYSFFLPNDGREWKKDSSSYYDEYTFDASDDGNTTATPIITNLIKISPMTVYRYGKNPLVSSSGVYNSSERIKRFFFIRLVGIAGVKLDNYLIAIDTYSKYIFAYAKITKYSDILGQLLPTEFKAIEHYHLGYKFYEYDPIGFIDANKNIILYQVYEDDMTANSSKYVPRYTGIGGKAAEQIDKTTTGHSPYAREAAKQ
ncbi:hypothetical protein BFL38_10455 [Brachyspira hampsonii]|uniref:Uncharacterized protein n=2 Tax=Brachyspira hampsonii TaxID=1287055 RepID=A0A1E5NI83_9SPIR|nr:hypothetical protein BFL38_10455 [Brachyspira hampsonii]